VGFVRSEDFIVFAPDEPLAEAVLARAEQLRRQIAEEWFGEELPPGAGRTLIHVRVDDREDSGLTWPKDPNDPRQKLHNVWITATRERVLEGLFAHEMTHAVFATKFPGGIPPWIEEAIASLYDDPERAASRRRILARYAKTGNWPDLEKVLAARRICATDDAAYCVGPSVVEYLLSRGGKATLIRFAVAANKKGCEAALRECYGLGSVNALQVAWQAWARQATHRYAAPRARRSQPLAAIGRRP
jgi:hypothetical protein